MKISPLKTPRIEAGQFTIFELLDQSLKSLNEKSVVAITSKVVSLCENRVIPLSEISKEELIKRESEYYLPIDISSHGHHFTIAHNIIVASGGADESNGNGNYVLWPEDPQKSANEIRQYLAKKHALSNIGVIITDSVVKTLRRGTNGIALTYSGFKPLHNYIGQPDLFGRPFEVTWANIADGLASAAVLVMGEGAEQTPIALIEDLSFVDFVGHDPTENELKDFKISLKDDLFAPFLNAIEWLPGDKSAKSGDK